MKKIIALTTAVIAIGFAGNAAAIPIEVSFSGNVFDANTHTTPYTPPTISGSFVYEAADVNSTIDSLIAVNLAINGFTYTLGDVGFDNSFGNGALQIGGSLNGVTTILGGTDDFLFRFSGSAPNTSLAFLNFFDGTTPSTLWAIRSSQNDFTSLSVTPVAAVPEPASLALVCLGLAGLGFSRRKRA